MTSQITSPMIPISAFDSISSICYSKANNILAATSWDSHVYLESFDAKETINKVLLDSPVISSAFNKTHLYAGCCSGLINKIDLTTLKPLIFGNNSNPVNAIYAHPISLDIIITTGFDGKVSIWDIRSDKNVFSSTLGKPLASAINSKGEIAIAQANKTIGIYDVFFMRNLNSQKSMLEQDIRCIQFSPDGSKLVYGSTEGKCAIIYLDATNKNFTFKCHREQTFNQQKSMSIIYAANTIAFTSNSKFITGGSDGNIFHWDIDTKSKISNLKRESLAINCSVIVEYNGANYYVYGSSDDWSQGCIGEAKKGYNKVDAQLF